MRLNKILLLLVFSLSCGVSYAEIYQWTDEQGTTHFSDKPITKNAKKLDIALPPKDETNKPVATKETKNNSESNHKLKNDKADSASSKNEPIKETAQEKTKKSRDELTEQLIKAREIREAKRKQQKEEAELQQIKCQEEKTKLALMKNELKEYDKKLKTMSRSDRPKSNEYIKKTDLETRMQRQKEITHELCN